MAPMGLQFGLGGTSAESAKTCLRKFRWLFKIDGLIGEGINALPPSQAARPNLTFTETEVRHLNETYYYPARPDWKPIQIVVFDIANSSSGSRQHPIFEWLKKLYDPSTGRWGYPVSNGNDSFIKQNATLEMYDGCGSTIERWVFQDVWPQVNDFQTLDMANTEIMTCDLTLRYARAFIEN